MPQLSEPPKGWSKFEWLTFQMLGDLKVAMEDCDKRIRSIEDARLGERSFRRGATWMWKIVYSVLGGLGALALPKIAELIKSLLP